MCVEGVGISSDSPHCYLLPFGEHACMDDCLDIKYIYCQLHALVWPDQFQVFPLALLLITCVQAICEEMCKEKPTGLFHVVFPLHCRVGSAHHDMACVCTFTFVCVCLRMSERRYYVKLLFKGKNATLRDLNWYWFGLTGFGRVCINCCCLSRWRLFVSALNRSQSKMACWLQHLRTDVVTLRDALEGKLTICSRK